jgi:2-polyprenyl-6-methoxyphenol hydroxylase-like FAD-dependent oxidoreductase
MRAIIVGAGIAGLTAANAFARLGIEPVVFEHRTDLDKLQIGTGLNVWANAIQALRLLGLEDEVTERGTPLEWLEQRSWRGRLLTRWPVGEIGRRQGAQSVSVSRPDLYAVLRERLDPSVVTYGAHATGFEEDGDSVTVHLDGRDDASGDLLVGADGLRSGVRRQLHGPTEPRYAGYVAWRGIVPFEDERLPADTFPLFWGPGRRFGFYKVGGGQVYWFGVCNAAEGGADSAHGRKQDVLDLFGDWLEPIPTLVRKTDDAVMQRTDIYDVGPYDSWGRGRTTLMGDAAHAMTFNLGQGACQAIEDAVVLANVLSGLRDVPDALLHYEELRRARPNGMIMVARRLGEASRWTNPVACASRDALMHVILSRVGPKRQAKDFAFSL